MKKQIVKLSLKTDKIVNLSKGQAQAILGAKPPEVPWSYARTCSAHGSAPCCTW